MTAGEGGDDRLEDLYENAPCGYLSTLLDGTIVKVNATLLGWLGYRRDELVGRRRFVDLLSVGGKLYHETHFAPLLRLQGRLGGIALELVTAAGDRIPVLVSSTTKTDGTGEPRLIRSTIFEAGDRRSYELELLRARQEADQARAIAEQARAASDEARTAAEQARASADQAREAALLEREHLRGVLATLQRSLLPPSLPAVPGLEAVAYYHTASPDNLGGDFYDLYPLGDDRWGFFLGDVSGKGPGAATVASLARYTLRAAALHDSDPACILDTLNTALYERRGEEGRYCTLVAGVLEPDGGGFEVTFASGGHPPPLLLGADGRAAYLPTVGGLLIGLLQQAPAVVMTTRLGPGDTLLLYTDGLIEARTTDQANDDGRADDGERGLADDRSDGERRSDDDGRYGEEALLTFAGHLAPVRPGGVIEAMAALLADLGEGLDDDTALLALGVPPADEPP